LLYVFCDGAKINSNNDDRTKVLEVQELVRNVSFCKDLIVTIRDVNFGLAKNVIEGVSEIINVHGKVIVLEDDLLLSTGFLSYMNKALDLYESKYKVKQVSGYLFPINIDRNNGSFFLPVTNTIGWGTWKKEWNDLDFEAKGYRELSKNKKLRKSFNLDGSFNYANMLEKQMKNSSFGSWAVLYWWNVFKSKGFVLYPDYALVQHNDFNHSGSHSGIDDHYQYTNWNNKYEIYNFPKDILANGEIFEKQKHFLKKYSKYSLKNILLHAKQFLKF